MKLNHLSNEELHQSIVSLAQKERLTTIEILWHLREIESRMLYAQKGYRDLKEYCVRELKYSEGSAWRRISAMRLLKDVPEIETKISQGNLNLTQLSKAQTHFREVRATKTEKQEVLQTLENKNTKVTERILAEAKPDSLFPKSEVTEKPLKGQKLELTLILDEALQHELEEIQILLGKSMTKLELLKLLAQEKLAKLRKQSKPRNTSERKAQPLRSTPAAKSKSVSKQSPTATRSRYISKLTLREMKTRDQHRCQYKDPETQQHCSAQHYLQTEHITPFAKGGSHDIRNLQLLCSTHNKLRAIQRFGTAKMKEYLPILKQ